VSYHRWVERYEDMSPDGKLRVFLQPDGDVVLSIFDSGKQMMASIEFCSVGSGGGRSPNTLEALRNLYRAIERDNKERPIRTVPPEPKEGA
jgi:hypothetical protein